MRNKYSFSEFIANCFAFLLTKIFYKPAKLIRRPVFIRGKKSMKIGKKMTTGHSCRFDLPGKTKTLFIGDNCELGDNTHIVALRKVTIGNNVLIASKVFISDTSHGVYKGVNQDSPIVPPNSRRLDSSEVFIGDNVWIGENAVILQGAIIGEGCVIGANAIITKEIPPYSVVVSSNKVIKSWNFDKKTWEDKK